MPDISGGRPKVVVPEFLTLSRTLYDLAEKGKDKLPLELCRLIVQAASKVSQHERGLVATFRANTPPGGNVNLTAFKVPARNGYKDALSQLKKTVAGPPQYTTQVDPPSMWIKFHRDLEYHLNLMLDIIDCDPMVFMKTAGYINPTMMALLIDMKDII